TAPDLPVAEQLSDPSGHQMSAQSGDEISDDGVAGRSTVAVLEQRHRAVAWRADEGRVAHDEVEGLPCDGLEHRPASDIPADAVESGVEGRVCQGPLGEVAHHDLARVAGEVQRLNPRAGADVESPRDAASWGPGCQ